MAAPATAAQPTEQLDMGALPSASRHPHPEGPNPTSLSQRTLCRYPSEVGTVCVNRASTGLCGGQRATAVPTATAADSRRTAQTGDRGETSVGKYMARGRKPPSQTWRTFLENHFKSMVSVDFFAVPTIRFQVLYVCLVLAHERRCILHFGVTAHPTAEWTVQQLRETFPWETAPGYLLRDRDQIFGTDFVKPVKAMGIKQVLAAPRSPWQRAYVERVIGSIRRECLHHVIVFSEAGLYRNLRKFADYYHRSRTHLGLQKDTPESRPVQGPEAGRIVAIPEVGGLHHRYERRAA